MREMRDYQKKAIKSKKDIIVCNWDRGKGKTSVLVEKISDSFWGLRKEKEDILYVTQGSIVTYMDTVSDKLDKYLKTDDLDFERSRDSATQRLSDSKI